MSTLLTPEERVLPTLNQDGTRRWMRPRVSKGRLYRRRLITGWALIALFVVLPFLRWNGKPVVLLDVIGRRFHLFGTTFLPTDGVLLMLLMLGIFLGIIFLTALLGRVWCGWGCPQTVYMEFLFRPLETWIEGGPRMQKRLDAQGNLSGRRLLKHAVFLVLAVLLGNVFLSYFVGVEQLGHWMTHSPAEHPGGFAVMAVTAGLVFFDFSYFREQMCTVVCPYARLQSVLLDTRSLIVGYDARRGEPRGKKGKTTGDCVDCKACVVTCPTGIDIREGLQLECIGCTQCIDACDSIMTKLGRPTGLIRYTSQAALQGAVKGKQGLLRLRTVLYPALLAGAVVGLVLVGRSHKTADLTLLRGIGAPFVVEGDTVRNHVRVKIHNRESEAKQFTVTLEGAPDAEVIAPENPVNVAPDEQAVSSVFVLVPKERFVNGAIAVHFRIADGAGFSKELPYKLLGPKGEAQ